MNKPIRDRIELAEITEISARPVALPHNLRSYEPHWKVRIVVRDDWGVPMMETTWYLKKSEWPDQSLLTMTRSWMYLLCKQIADEMGEWTLPPEGYKGYLRNSTSVTDPSIDPTTERS